MKSESVDECREGALTRMRRWGEVDVCVYTDGSAVGGVRMGGAGVVVTNGDFENPVLIDERMRAAGVITSSYQAELYALWEALLWLLENAETWERVMIVSDSQSGLMALRNVGSSGEELLLQILSVGKQLCANGKELIFIWVPGHCGLTGNEWADAVAKRAVLNEQTGCKCLYKTVKCLLKKRERE